jgi:hypothetical protein
MRLEQVSREQIIRPYVDLWNSRYPEDRTTVEKFSADFARMPDGAFEEHRISADGDAVLSCTDHDGKQPVEHINIDMCLKRTRDEELLPKLVEFVNDLQPRTGAKIVAAWIQDLDKQHIHHLELAGFKVVQRIKLTRLDLASFDLQSFQAELDRLKAEGLRFATIKELQDDGVDWAGKLYEPSWQMIQDMPHAHPPVLVPLDRFRVIMSNPHTHDPELMFVVMDGEEIVGYSRMEKEPAMPHLIRTGLSGVVRSHRRRGIVTALKAHSIAHAKSLGYQLVQTDNDETNPMFQINLRLGFKEAWHWLHYERQR